MTEDRRLAVLRAIVEDYVATHEPVGSRSLVERHSLGVSPATIRNDMAALEDEGLIAQPHTSAGRVPTDAGYRLFVDKLAAIKPMSQAERRAIGQFLDGAVEALDALSNHRLVLLTKGDLKDQHRKIDASQLAERFDAIEIMHEKDPPAYTAAFTRHGIDPARFVMVGNSLKSDVLPVLGLGGWAIHVPYATTWAIEHAEEPTGHPRFVGPATLHDVPRLVGAIVAGHDQ